jgi:hypothetical protein
MKLSPGTRRRVDLLFAREHRDAAARLLVEQCGSDLPSWTRCDPRGLERVRFAALKVSEGDLERLRAAVALAREDWRDLLVAASFADDDAHEAWPSGARTKQTA